MFSIPLVIPASLRQEIQEKFLKAAIDPAKHPEFSQMIEPELRKARNSIRNKFTRNVLDPEKHPKLQQVIETEFEHAVERYANDTAASPSKLISNSSNHPTIEIREPNSVLGYFRQQSYRGWHEGYLSGGWAERRSKGILGKRDEGFRSYEIRKIVSDPEFQKPVYTALEETVKLELQKLGF